MTMVALSLALRMCAAFIVGALSQRHALLGQWHKALFLLGIWLHLLRGAMLRAIELHMLRKGFTDDLIAAQRFVQSPNVSIFIDIILLIGAIAVLAYYSQKAWRATECLSHQT
jgi:hypothetical protein